MLIRSRKWKRRFRKSLLPKSVSNYQTPTLQPALSSQTRRQGNITWELLSGRFYQCNGARSSSQILNSEEWEAKREAGYLSFHEGAKLKYPRSSEAVKFAITPGSLWQDTRSWETLRAFRSTITIVPDSRYMPNQEYQVAQVQMQPGLPSYTQYQMPTYPSSSYPSTSSSYQPTLFAPNQPLALPAPNQPFLPASYQSQISSFPVNDLTTDRHTLELYSNERRSAQYDSNNSSQGQISRRDEYGRSPQRSRSYSPHRNEERSNYRARNRQRSSYDRRYDDDRQYNKPRPNSNYDGNNEELKYLAKDLCKEICKELNKALEYKRSSSQRRDRSYSPESRGSLSDSDDERPSQNQGN